ncbi:hypothetical protein FUT87_02855 [Mitsuaria sp. TWR114]|uniref:hypothetical protein n=1 Tax=Mitsuaria sp. TWR114 TaxID=2601731 RepID=UPI0011BE2741|nr:hypothetical protein [Mitsuaria sp. TWR114]TXD99418.1 hypothetical protein FUT87_02855 [Mitsuaria sp. TWR114]
MKSTLLEAAQLLRNLRAGRILQPAELADLLSDVPLNGAVGRYAIQAAVPHWLAEKMEAVVHLRLRGATTPTIDRRDTILALVFQGAGVQLRCVMQLSAAAVKAYLADAVDAGTLTLALLIESTHECVLLRVPLDERAGVELLKEVGRARPSSYGSAPARQMAAMHCQHAYVPSIVEGQTVTDVVTVHVQPSENAERVGGAGVEHRKPNRHSLH